MATQSLALSGVYQLLGAGPLTVTLEEGSLAMLHIASSLPAATAPPHRLRRGAETVLRYTETDNVYARKTDQAVSVSETVKVSYT
jgi:hypothetical protein